MQSNECISGKEWMALAIGVLKSLSGLSDGRRKEEQRCSSIEKAWVIEQAIRRGWNQQQIEIIQEEFHIRKLESIQTWHGYATARKNRMDEREARKRFKETVEKIASKNGQIHPWFKIESLFVYGSFARPFNPERGIGDIDFMVEMKWSGPEGWSGKEKLNAWNEWMKQTRPFHERISIGFCREYSSQVIRMLEKSAKDREWQAVMVLEASPKMEKSHAINKESQDRSDLVQALSMQEKESLKLISEQTKDIRGEDILRGLDDSILGIRAVEEELTVPELELNMSSSLFNRRVAQQISDGKKNKKWSFKK